MKAPEPIRRYRHDADYHVPEGPYPPAVPWTTRTKPAREPRVERPPTPRGDCLDSLDPGIQEAVRVLIEAGIYTCQSCEGGPGHASHEPMVHFLGPPEAGMHAVSVCLAAGLPVRSLRRAWHVQESAEPTGPIWEITFATRLG